MFFKESRWYYNDIAPMLIGNAYITRDYVEFVADCTHEFLEVVGDRSTNVGLPPHSPNAACYAKIRFTAEMNSAYEFVGLLD